MELVIALALFIGMIVSWLKLPSGVESTITKPQRVERPEESIGTVRRAA